MTTFEELYDKPCEPRLLASQFPDQLMAEEMSLIQKILFSYTLKKNIAIFDMETYMSLY